MELLGQDCHAEAELSRSSIVGALPLGVDERTVATVRQTARDSQRGAPVTYLNQRKQVETEHSPSIVSASLRMIDEVLRHRRRRDAMTQGSRQNLQQHEWVEDADVIAREQERRIQRFQILET